MWLTAYLFFIATSTSSALAVIDTRHIEKGLLGKIIGDEVSTPVRPAGVHGDSSKLLASTTYVYV